MSLGLKQVDYFFRKYRFVFILSIYGILLFFFFRMMNKSGKEYAKNCSKERELVFDGVISFYYSDVNKGTASFCINNSDSCFTIPRSLKAINLEDGDTIKKVRGENRYIVRWKGFGTNSLIKKAIDTFNFECPGK